MKWKEFKEFVDSCGVSEDDEIWFIDVRFPEKDSWQEPKVAVDEQLGLNISN